MCYVRFNGPIRAFGPSILHTQFMPHFWIGSPMHLISKFIQAFFLSVRLHAMAIAQSML